MKKIIIVSILAAVGLGFMSYKFTHAYFTASAVSAENVFKTAESFDNQATESAHVLINEVSPNGDSDQDWIELFNPTNQNIDLTGWKIHDNGANPESLSESPTILANGYAVIVASSSAISVPEGVTKIVTTSSSIGNGLSSDGDYVKLLTPNNLVVDQMSYGLDSTVFLQPPAAPTSGKTLQRIPNGQDTDSANDWKLSAPTLGGPNQ